MKYLDTILEKYQVRKTKAQKTAFLDWAKGAAEEMGYDARVEEYEKDAFKCRNLIVGNPETAKVIYTAHYDTQPVMPLPNMVFPKNFLITMVVQLPMILVILLVGIAASQLMGLLVGKESAMAFMLRQLAFLAAYFAMFSLLFFGPANKHTANDNTSGTACLLEMMAQLPPEERGHAAFVFFDQEEKGKLGSLQFAKKYPAIKENGFVFNLDCIGDGKNMMIVAPKKTTKEELDALQQLFSEENGFSCVAETANKASYNSDQRSFKKGYAVAAMHRHPLFGLHLKRIHTRRDTICEAENLQYVVDGALKLLKQKTEEQTI